MREIRLGVGHGRPGSGHVALVDDWRFELVGQFAWWAHTNKGLVYARREYHDATGEHGQYMHNLGRFADEAEAARAYDAAAREAFGEFSWCNFSDKDGNDSN